MVQDHVFESSSEVQCPKCRGVLQIPVVHRTRETLVYAGVCPAETSGVLCGTTLKLSVASHTFPVK